tara:strand:- start:1171 stop:1719 length:549 start_codon:yes stop_codon:yes gene_type:complete
MSCETSNHYDTVYYSPATRRYSCGSVSFSADFSEETTNVDKEEIQMSKFREGDLVAKISGKDFINDKLVCTVDYTENTKVWIKETGLWVEEASLYRCQETSGPIKSDGGSSSYYTLLINDNKVETEEIIRDVFGNDFDFGNAFKSLVRAYGTKQGGGKEGNTVQYEMSKLRYSSEKIEKKNG